MGKIKHLLGVSDQPQTFIKHQIIYLRNKTWFTVWGEKILPELTIQNLIFYVLQSSSLVLAVLMSSQNTENK